MKFPNFIGPSYASQSVAADSERCINFYPEIAEVSGAKSRAFLYPTPGFSTFATAAQAPVRGMFAQDGRCFIVIAHVLYELSSDGTLTSRGTVVYDSNPVTFSHNGDAGGELFITSGGLGYILTLGTNVQTTELASGAYQGGFLDGFFLALDTATSTLQISDLLDGTTWDPTQIAQRTAGSDRWIAMSVSGGVIWLFGTRTSEVWYNAGTSPFPFALIPGAVLQHGILAPFSVANLGAVPVWLGQNIDGSGVVYQANGFVAQRVSNHAVEHALRKYVSDGYSISDAVGWTYQEEGHLFYVLNFPSADATWVYDASNSAWHERGYWDNVTSRFKASRVQFHAWAFDKHLVGDRLTGVIYEQSLKYYTDVDGYGIRRVRRCPHLTSEQTRTFYSSLTLDMEVGIGVNEGTGETGGSTATPDAEPEGGHYWYQVDSLTLTAGSIAENTLRSTYDANTISLKLAEVPAATPGFIYDFVFEGIPNATATGVQLYARYSGMVDDLIKVQQWNYSDEQWEDLTVASTDISGGGSEFYRYHFTLKGAQWEDPENLPFYALLGQLKIRIYKVGAGSNSSFLLIDQMRLTDSGPIEITLPSVTPVEPVRGVDPQVMLRISRDGGRTFWDAPPCKAGRIGEYRTRVGWSRLGSARDAVFEVIMTDPVPWRLVDAYLDVQSGLH